MGTRFNGGEFTPNTINALFDSGTSGVYIPSHDASGFMKMICDNFPESSGISCNEKFDVYNCTTHGKIPSLPNL